MSIENWVALITALSALIGAVAAAIWGHQNATTKDSVISAKDAELNSLRATHQDALQARDALLDVHKAEIARLQDWSPTSIQERYLALTKVLEHQIAEKTARSPRYKSPPTKPTRSPSTSSRPSAKHTKNASTA